MDSDTMRSTIQGCELFEGLDEGQMGVLVMKANSREFSAGETIYEKGDDSGGTFALICSGRVGVVADNGFVLIELGAEEIIGEIGVMSKHEKRTKTITTIEPTEILEWHVREIEEGSPELLERLKDLAWKRLQFWYE